MADRLIESGAKVTAVGRRTDKLNEFVAKHGDTKAKAVPFDIGDTKQIPHFAAEYAIPRNKSYVC